MSKMKIVAALAAVALLAIAGKADACTGITLKSQDGSTVVARTIEWGGSDLNSRYAIVPRGYTQQSYIPGGVKGGMKFTAKYGYVGLSVEQEEFVAEGLNEHGLSAGLFYFPGYGQYEDYDESLKAQSVADLQLVSWILGGFKTVDEVVEGLKDVHVIAIDPRASTAHWRVADPSGRQIVVEIVGKKVCVYENKLGVLTNSPGFEWQMTNLNNYRHPTLTLRPRGTLPGHRAHACHGRWHSKAMLPNTEQLRHSHRHRDGRGRNGRQHTKRDAVDVGHRHDGAQNLLPHDVQQCHPNVRPRQDKLRKNEIQVNTA